MKQGDMHSPKATQLISRSAKGEITRDGSGNS